jgi:hypothetical protein
MVLGHPKRAGSTNCDASISNPRSDSNNGRAGVPENESGTPLAAGSALSRAMTDSGISPDTADGEAHLAAKLRTRISARRTEEPEAAMPQSHDGANDDAGGFDRDAPEQALVTVHPDMPKVNPNLVFGSTMALWQPPRFTAQELVDTINEILEGTGASAQFDEAMGDAGSQPKFSLLKRRLKGPPSAVLRINGLKTLVGGGDKPAFSGKALAERVNPALWADGVQRLSNSRGHVMIADAQPNDPDDPDLNYDRAVAVTVTAAAVSLLTDPAGIVWHPAGNATPPDVIPDFIQSLADGLAPLPLWLRWLLVPPPTNRNPGCASRGLEALLGMEMEIAPNKKSLEQTVGHLFQLAAIHVRLGKAPPDGSQVGTKDKTWYHVEYVDEGAVTGTPVYRLTPVSAFTGD